MVGKLLIKGMLAGLFAGFLTFCFMKSYGEPWVDRAIAIEEQQSAAAGIPAEPELVSRQTQAGAGLLTGVLVFGAAAGGLFAIAFAFANGRLGTLDERSTAILLAAIGFVAVILVPVIKYPPNPPAVGSGDTIAARTELYFIMMAFSLLAATAGVMLARRLWATMGGWNAVLSAVAAYVAVVVLAQLALPSVNEVPETFSADTLWNFRFAAISGHVIFWSVLGIGFGILQHGFAGSRVGALLSRPG